MTELLTAAGFSDLVARLGEAATAGDGRAFAACFTPDGIYNDYIYGAHQGRASIADMLENLFHRDATDYHWQFLDPVTDGRIGYARSLSRFVSIIPAYKGNKIVIDGTSRFILKDGLIGEYFESVNGGVAMTQLGVGPERIAKVLRRWSDRLLSDDEVARYAKGFKP